MTLESEFHEEMLNIYRKALNEANYNAVRFLQMVVNHGGVETAHRLINAANVSEGYTALWERKRLDLTVEALVVENQKYHPLFSNQEIGICKKRLEDYGYNKTG